MITKEDFDNVNSADAKPTVGTVGLAEISGSRHETEDGDSDTANLIDDSKFHKRRRTSVSKRKFIQYCPCDDSFTLRMKHPFAFLLLTLIAERARRTYKIYDGLDVGEAYIGDHQTIGALNYTIISNGFEGTKR